MGIGAVSRYKLPTELGTCHGIQNYIAGTGAESGWLFIRVKVKESSMFKNRDKQMTYIVRVMRSILLLSCCTVYE
jgi:hypothetical protein